jgi:signal transduction histidine kinase
MERLRQETTDLIVHDLRNPLSSIMGAIKVLQLLLPNDISADSRELLDIVLASAGRMQRLADSMLEVSRMQAGESELQLSLVDLGELVNRVTESVLRPHLKELQFSVVLPTESIRIDADRDKLERVLANLLDNAAKHTPNQGKITVTVISEEEAVQVRVVDTGPGIPPEERLRIFERFAQVAGEKSKRRGFGLGLIFCKLTVAAHGGAIWMEPGPEGIGSCFAFRLPKNSPSG